MESNQVTSSGKKCRSKIYERYHEEIDLCYEMIEKSNKLTALVDILQQVISHHTQEPVPINDSTNFWNYGLDSLGIASFAHQIHTKQLFKQIPFELCKKYLMHSQSIKSFMELMGQQTVGQQNSQSFLSHDWQLSALQDLNWSHSPSLKNLQISDIGGVHILLIRGTGFIGSTIFVSLMNLEVKSLTIILRKGRRATNIFQRFISTLLSLNLPQWSTEAEIIGSFSAITISSPHGVLSSSQEGEESLKPKLFLLEGDISEPNFSLSEQLYAELLSRITVCVSASGQTSFLSSYYQMRSSNVLASQQLIQFLIHSKNQIRLIFISSLSASHQPSLPSCCFYELSLQEYHQFIIEFIHSCSDDRSLSIGYPLSKMIAEYLISSHCEMNQIPYVSIQLGTVSSHSETGFSNFTDFTTRLIHSLVTSNTVPIIDASSCGSIDLLPVDFVGKVVALFVAKDIFPNKIMPLYTSSPTLFYDLITETLAYLSHTYPSPKDFISIQDWTEQLKPLDPLFPLASIVMDLLLSPNPSLRRPSVCTEKMIIQISPCEEITVSFEEFEVRRMIPRIVDWIMQYRENDQICTK